MTTFENEIESKGYLAFPNEGDSMMPLLREHKDIMVIRKITEPLKRYDAVLFKRPSGRYLMHRIVKVCGNGTYLIAGDNRHFEETVPEEWIIGILDEVIRDGKHISVTSCEYQNYLKKVPWHRFWLKVKWYAKAPIRKIKRMLGKNDK